jgi:hypothetical protein
MEKFADIIEKIESQKLIKPPDNLVNQVMVGVKKAESGFPYKFNRFLFQPRELSSDAVSILSGKIISHRQCSFLLFMVGLLYLIVGLIVTLGLKDALSIENINLWLRIQPYITIVSAILIICTGLFILYNPQTIIVAQYGIIVHTIFIAVNACILELLLFSPVALFFTLALTAAAIIFGVLLISSIRSFLKSNILTQRYEYV